MPPPPQPPSPPQPPPPLPYLHASKLPLPIVNPTISSSRPTSLLFEPTSNSLAILLSDSSTLLFSNFSSTTTTSSTPPPPPPTQIPSVYSCCFSPLLPSSHVVFFAASPSPTSTILLRAWLLAPSPLPRRFVPTPLAFKRRRGSSAAAGISLDALAFGFGVRLAGAGNVLAIHSLAAGQIWLLGPRLDTSGGVELQKCAVVELEAARPVYAMGVMMGRLLLGEAGGLRVFPLRVLMKGGKRKEKGGGGGGGGEFGKKNGVKDLRRKNGVMNGMVVVPFGSGGDGDRAFCKFFAPFSFLMI